MSDANHARPAADRNLLFGILALQMDFIGRDALTGAMHAWVLDKTQPLGQILQDQGALRADNRVLLDALVARHLEMHAHDPRQSLAALSSVGPLRQDLKQLADADVQATLAQVSAAHTGKHLDTTTDHPGSGTMPPQARFVILRPHARGGLGEVFVARDAELKREVALKEIQQRHADKPESRARFLLEAEVTGGLEHPGIVPVYGLGSYADGRPFYAMRFIKGDSLKDAIAAFHQADRQGRSPSERSLALRQLLGRFVDVCQAIAYAHSCGVLHRDLKPGNIMLGKYGETLVVDWGLAKVQGQAEAVATEGALVSAGELGLTQTGKALGTPAFMSPEQAVGRLDQLGPASDVYSLGATLYCLLTGQAAFAESDVGAVLNKVQRGDFPPPRQLNSRVPAGLEAVCMKAMALKPEERYATPRELAEEIERWLADEPVRVHREPVYARLGRWLRKHPALAAGVAALLLTGVIALAVSTLLIGSAQRETAEALQKEEQARKDRALAQLNALRDAAPGAVPGILADLERSRADVLPRLRELWAAGGDDKKRLRLALALAPVDADAVRAPLLAGLLEADDPAEVLLIRDALLPHKEELRERLWALAEEAKTPAKQRLRALTALAAFDPANARWDKAGQTGVELLLTANPFYQGPWVRALRPVRAALRGRLAAVCRGEKLAEFRQIAALVLADYAADEPELVAEMLLDADPKQSAVFLPVLAAHREKAIQRLRRELAVPVEKAAPLTERELLAKRQATASVALLHLGEDDSVWPLLRHTPEPETRSQLVWRVGLHGVDPLKLVRQLEVEKDMSARRALLVALGDYTGEQLPAAVRAPLTRKLLAWYRDDPDPGIHGALDWLLRHDKEGPEERPLDWGQAKALQQLDEGLKRRDPDGVRGWYVNREGQTLVLVPGPVEFRMGSPAEEPGHLGADRQHRRRIGRSYAIASKPVTVAQFQRFLKDRPKMRRPTTAVYAPEGDCPIMGVSWYMAAKYCNWLSAQEGIPEAQWCYPKRADIKEGMKPYPDYLTRQGYRLATEAEWEYACRAGATSSRYYGSSVELLPRYAWYIHNSQYRSRPVGQKRPNDLGLFDMHGNVWTWVQDAGFSYPQGEGAIEDKEDTRNIEDRISRVLRGGSFNYLPLNARSACRGFNRPDVHNNDVGLRVARTYD